MHLASWEEISPSIIRQSYQSVVKEIQSLNKRKPPQKSWSSPLHRSYRIHHSLYFICEIPWNRFLSISPNCVSAQLHPTLCNSLDCSPPGYSVHGISQAKILEWVAIFSSGDLLNPGIRPACPGSPALQVNSLPVSHWGIPPVPKLFYCDLSNAQSIITEDPRLSLSREYLFPHVPFGW